MIRVAWDRVFIVLSSFGSAGRLRLERLRADTAPCETRSGVASMVSAP
jgi:hypothetical protein